MTSELKPYLLDAVNRSRKIYLDDLEAMSAELLAQKPGGSARSGFDMTYELAYVNGRLASRLKGLPEAPFQFGVWLTAPEEFANKETAIREFDQSVDNLIAAFESETDIRRPIETPNGQTTPLDLMTMAARHIMYHDAQLNYIQSLNGDTEVHWKF